MVIDTQQTVRDLVRNNPSAVGVLESLGIDYCCGGNKSLSEACRVASLPLETIIKQLEEALRLPPIQEDCHWLTSPLTELADHIVETHHEYSRMQLPVLTALAAKVNLRHGANKPELARLQELVDALAQELTSHMLKEEQVLFPLFRRMQANADAGCPLDPAIAEGLLYPVRRMMEEHDDAGELLRAIRSVTNDYQLPNGACTSFQTLYAGLKQHEEDLHRHGTWKITSCSRVLWKWRAAGRARWRKTRRETRNGVTGCWFAGVYGFGWRWLLPSAALLECGGYLIFFVIVRKHRPKQAAGALLIVQTRSEAWMRVVMGSSMALVAALLWHFLATDACLVPRGMGS